MFATSINQKESWFNQKVKLVGIETKKGYVAIAVAVGIALTGCGAAVLASSSRSGESGGSKVPAAAPAQVEGPDGGLPPQGGLIGEMQIQVGQTATVVAKATAEANTQTPAPTPTPKPTDAPTKTPDATATPVVKIEASQTITETRSAYNALIKQMADVMKQEGYPLQETKTVRHTFEIAPFSVESFTYSGPKTEPGGETRKTDWLAVYKLMNNAVQSFKDAGFDPEKAELLGQKLKDVRRYVVLQLEGNYDAAKVTKALQRKNLLTWRPLNGGFYGYDDKSKTVFQFLTQGDRPFDYTNDIFIDAMSNSFKDASGYDGNYPIEWSLELAVASKMQMNPTSEMQFIEDAFNKAFAGKYDVRYDRQNLKAKVTKLK